MSRPARLRSTVALSFVLLSLYGCSDELAEAVQENVTVDVVTTTDLGGFTDIGDTGEPEGDIRTDVSGLDESTPIPFIPCQTNTDCESGWCVETSEGRTCTRTCIEDCPGGWTCAAVGNVDTDITYICLPRNVNLCKPCRNDSECKSPGDPGTNTCVNYGPQGSFCAVDCSASACPDGYGCEGGQCVKSDGVCDCSWKAVKDAASTTCNASSELGTCYGARTCLSGALSSCDAPAPAAETCNSADDDCDGLTDEALELGACTATSDFGTCTGVTVCEDGTTVCTAKTPELEVCNGKDDDCDGLADEGFADANADGLADCVSTDDDLDGVLDGTDNCPTIPNADQKDLDGDDIGDVCDGDRDGDGDSNDSDCAPDDPAVGSKQTEQCNGKDDNCSGTVDEGFANLDADTEADCVDVDDDGDNIPDATDNCPYTSNEDQSDLDGDGKGNVCENDLDGDLDPDGADCAPQDPSIHHGATEQCDGKDQNCNGIIDEGSPDSDLDAIADCLDTDDDGDGILDEADNCPGGKNPDQLDTDGDGLGDGCDGDDDGDGAADPLDCAPLDPERRPGATETCNGKDDDCNGVMDENGAQGCVERLYDGDGDGFGLSGVVLCTCTASFPYTTVEGGDCNDANSQVFPGATEACNAKDDDCNGIPDEPGSTGCLVRYEDLDSDGYGTTSACVCAGTTGYALLAGDCADGDPSRHPGADEICDAEGIDENCNGASGEQNAKGCTTWYFDGDGDTFGIATSSRCLCAAEGKYAAAVSGDCNDVNPAMAPTLAETCDLLDNNCNGQVDEGVMSPFYKDNDGDLYGGTSVKEACTAPIGYAPDAGDCNDYNPGVHPGATELCDDLDGDCDGLVDEGLTLLTIYRDNDGDGFASSAAVATQKCNIPVGYTTAKDVTGDGKSDWDCSDSNVVAYPKADEICDGADNDCDGIVDVQCPDACPGTWPFDVSIPHHTPIRLIDLDGDSIDELIVIDSTGKLWRVSPNGTGTAVCPALTFSGAADARTSFTVNPALGNWKVHLVQGTRIWDLEACAEVKASAGDLTGFGVVGDWDGDLSLDYAGHLQVSASTCFKRAATWTTSCVASPTGKPWDGAMVVWELDGDGRDEVIAVRGRTFPGTTYYDGYTDIFGWNGTAMVVEASIAPPNASFVGSHLVAPTIADFGNDGYASLRLLAGNVLLDPVNKVGAGFFSTIDTVPLPQLADLDQDGDLDGAARGALVDLDGDGKPESISAAGNEISVRSADAQKLPLDGWPQLAGTFAWSVDVVVGDVNNDTRLEVYSPSVDGAIYCNRLGLGSANPERIIERGDANWLNRTNAKDPFEPSNTMARAWPLRFPTKEIRAYLTKGDVDYYRLPGVGGLMVQLVSPPGEDYDFELMNQDGTKVYTSGKQGVGKLDSAAICVACNEPAPPTYLVRVYPKDAAQHYSAGRPYVLRILTSP